VIAHVAPSYYSEAVISNDHLIVHAVIDPIQIYEEIQHLIAAIRKGIEQADLDVGVRVHCGNRIIISSEAHIIHKQPYSDTSISCPDQPVGKYTTGLVPLPDVDLNIERLLGEIGHTDPDIERIPARRYQ
jgi:hypothetical protein